MVDQQTIDRVAAAIDSAEIGHSMRLIRLIDGVSTYRLEIEGSVEEFTDDDTDSAIDQVYARIRKVRQRKQAEAVIAALTPPTLVVGPSVNEIMEQAQVFASTYSLVGGRFDDDSKMQQSEEEKAELRRMISALATGGSTDA